MGTCSILGVLSIKVKVLRTCRKDGYIWLLGV